MSAAFLTLRMTEAETFCRWVLEVDQKKTSKVQDVELIIKLYLVCKNEWNKSDCFKVENHLPLIYEKSKHIFLIFLFTFMLGLLWTLTSIVASYRSS